MLDEDFDFEINVISVGAAPRELGRIRWTGEVLGDQVIAGTRPDGVRSEDDLVDLPISILRGE